VRYAVDLDYQLAVECYEIDYVPVDRVLATKFPSRQLPIA
jgi:hypothetical protein